MFHLQPFALYFVSIKTSHYTIIIQLLKLFTKYLPGLKKIIPTEPVEAYDLWSPQYDDQPGNLMLDLDELIFSELLQDVEISGKVVYDIGCGTGRHWSKLMDKTPANLTGFDVSSGMLMKLKARFPSAHVKQIANGTKIDDESNSCDVLISTLTVAHIQKIREGLTDWCRLLKPSSEIIITDFHPDALSHGAQRTFRQNNRTIVVKNYIHTVESVKEILFANGFHICSEQHRKVDETVKHYYIAKNAIDIYDRFFGIPIIYGLHVKR